MNVAADFDDMAREQGGEAIRRALSAARWVGPEAAPYSAFGRRLSEQDESDDARERGKLLLVAKVLLPRTLHTRPRRRVRSV
jgi:hypothetical protein